MVGELWRDQCVVGGDRSNEFDESVEYEERGSNDAESPEKYREGVRRWTISWTVVYREGS